ncbi:MAG: hypothetical protein Q9M89_05135, partial [Persephonella sp.]|nr:hypothetical protein [Persephonella sp.]
METIQTGVIAVDSGYQTSDADICYPRDVTTNQINDRVVIGIGAYGVSGMGVDYRIKWIKQNAYNTS